MPGALTIGLVGPTYPLRGGIAHYNARLAAALLDAGHRVRAVGFSRMYPDALFPGRTQRDHSARPIDPSARAGYQQVAQLDSLWPPSWVRAGAALAAERPALVLFHWWHPFFAPCYRACAFAARAPVAMLCHNVAPHEDFIGRAALSRLALAGADALLVQSRQDAAAVAELLRGTRAEQVARCAAVLPHPTYDAFGPPVERDAARAALALPRDAEVALFFGYVRPYKGLEVLLRALPAALRARPTLQLVVAGELYQPRAPLERLARQLGVAERVRLVDRYVANEDVATYFGAADVVVQPYVTASQSGITQVAFAHRRPVIVSSAGGLPDAVDDGRTGFVVPPGDATALASAITRFFEKGSAEAMRLAIAKDAAAGRFSWREVVDALVDASRGAR